MTDEPQDDARTNGETPQGVDVPDRDEALSRVAYSSTFDGVVAACAHVLGEPVCIRAVDRLGVALDDGTTCSTDGVGYTARDRLVEEHGEEALGREVLVVDVPTDDDAKPWVRTETAASALFVE